MTWYFVSGFFYSLESVVIAMLAIQLHLLLFGGCAITRLQQKLGFVPKETEFIPYVIEKITKVRPNYYWSSVIFYVITAFPMLVAIIRET